MRDAAALLARRGLSTSSTGVDAALVRSLLRELHPDRVHGHAAAEAANGAAFAAVAAYVRGGNGDGRAEAGPVRVTAFFRGDRGGGDRLRRVDATLPPPASTPARVALRGQRSGLSVLV